jgi:putative peptidoglycan lipid II flippase
MVRRIFSFLHKEVSGVHNAAYLLASFAFLSQLLALVRDRLLAHSFGAGISLDIYYGAFRIPDLIFAAVASMVSISVLIPFFSGKIDKENEGQNKEANKEAREFMNNIFTAYFLVMVFVSLIAYALIPYLARFILPALKDTEAIAEFVSLSRILLLQPIALGLSNLFGSLTQVTNRFYVYALSPIFYNFFIILGIIFLFPYFGLQGVVIGVVLGSVIHALIQVPTVLRLGIFPKFITNIKFETLKSVVMISIPRTLTLSLNSLELIFITSYASFMLEGSIAIFNFSLNLQSVPFAIIGVSYSLAAFPTLSKLFGSGEREKFLEHIMVATRHIIFWSLPVMALFIVLRAQIVRVILGSGSFDWNDTRLTAACLALFVFSLVAQSLELLFVRGYYASGNTRKPLTINIIFSIITIILPFIFIKIFNQVEFIKYFVESLFKVEDIAGSEVLMLPLGYSVGTIANMIILWFVFTRDFKVSFAKVWRTMGESGAAAIIMGFVAYVFLNIFAGIFNTDTLPGIFLQGLFSGLISMVIGACILYILKNEEIREISRLIPKRIFRQKMVVLEQNRIE